MTPIQYEELDRNLVEIQGFIEEQINSQDPMQIKLKIEYTASMSATSTSVQASCRYWLDMKRKEVFRNSSVQESLFKLSASLQKQLVDSYLAKDIYRYELAQRQNAHLTHILDALRSLLSFAKAEMEISRHSAT
jgi:hypothetical protein